MDISESVDFALYVLRYVLPAAFVWSLTHVAVKAIIKAATGRTVDHGL